MSTAIRADERAMKVMAYADGELEGDERASVERWLAEDAEATLFANDLAELGELVVMGHARRPAIAKFDVADAVMAKIAAEEKRGEKAEDKPAAKVVPLKPRSAPTPKSRTRQTVGWIAAGLALAASVFFVTRGKQDDEAPLARTTSPLVQPAQNLAATVGSTGSVEIENPGSSVSVIYVPDEKSTVPNVTTVVWVNESGGK